MIGTEHPGGVIPEQSLRSDEEAGSIVLQISSVVNEKEKDEEADETAAAKKTEEISKEDVEIRRLTEERRNTPKEEEQRLKEVSKRVKKNASGTKQQDIQRILEDFEGVKNIPGIKSANRKSTHHQDKE